MNDMRELITVDAFNRALVIVSAAWFVLALAIGGLLARRGGPGLLRRSIAWAALGPLAFFMWKFYSWMVRVEPETGYVGLHKVSVFAINVLVFVLVGAIAGLLFARLYARPQDGTHQQEPDGV